jgi:glycosyltransferase involved in cell wall biosynthesis
MKTNILLLWDRIGDYHAARFYALERKAGNRKVFIADIGGADALYKWKNPLQESTGYRSLSEKPVEEADSHKRLQQFKKLVREQNIGIVGIAGYGRADYRKMMHWCRMNGIRIILFAESWYPGRMDFLKGIYLRCLCQGFLVSGLRAQDHFVQRLGIQQDKIRIPYSVVDNAHFERADPDFSLKKILCLARFSPEKNLDKLLQAFGESGIAARGWTLELVGGGPLKQVLEKQAPEGVIFREWLAYDHLPELYQSASFFILPSRFEPWGLVVNEAMASGLPVLVSEECGCRPDLVPQDEFCFSAGDVNRMAITLKDMASFDAGELRRLGAANRKRIASFSPEIWADSFLELAKGR